MKTNIYIPSARADGHATIPAARRMRLCAVSGTLILLLSGLTALPAGAAGAPDPYLQALDAEGDLLESLGKAKQEQETLMRQVAAEKAPASSRTAPAPVARSVPASSAPTLNMQGFESTLRQNFPGSYALYSLMDQSEKDLVYAEYQKKKGEGNARFIPVVMKIIAVTNASSKSRERVQRK